MEIHEFKNRIASLNNLIRDKVSEPENKRYPIYDGAVDAERYFNSTIKIAWLLKEAYQGKNGVGGNWNYSELLAKDSVYEDFFGSHASRATWHPIIYVSHGILNNFLYYNDMDSIKDDTKMSFVVRDIAIINTQKLPAKNVTSSNMGEIHLAFDKYKDILKSQIDILNPDIIIGGSTMSLYKSLFDLKDEDAYHLENVKYYFKNNKVFIDAFHPAQRTVGREKYIDEIISAAEEWFDKFKK